MADIYSPLPYDFYTRKPLEVKFSSLDLSSDAGFLLVRQAEQRQQICQGIVDCLEDRRDPSKIKHTISQLVSQRIYQIAGGYENTNDSNYLRHDPILKIACERVPLPGEELLASQPTMSRLENQVTKKELAAIRRLFVEKFIHSGKGVAGILRWLFWRLKRAWPQVQIILRGVPDSLCPSSLDFVNGVELNMPSASAPIQS
jgi:hypothetical protein